MELDQATQHITTQQMHHNRTQHHITQHNIIQATHMTQDKTNKTGQWDKTHHNV